MDDNWILTINTTLPNMVSECMVMQAGLYCVIQPAPAGPMRGQPYLAKWCNTTRTSWALYWLVKLGYMIKCHSVPWLPLTSEWQAVACLIRKYVAHLFIACPSTYQHHSWKITWRLVFRRDKQGRRGFMAITQSNVPFVSSNTILKQPQHGSYTSVRLYFSSCCWINLWAQAGKPHANS